MAAPKAPEGAVTYEKKGEKAADTQYRFAYSPADVVAAEFDGFVAVDDKAEAALLDGAQKDAAGK